MTEQNQNTPPENTEAPESTGSGRFAAFNESLSMYVGGVRDSKAEANEVAKGIREGGHKATVREV